MAAEDLTDSPLEILDRPADEHPWREWRAADDADTQAGAALDAAWESLIDVVPPEPVWDRRIGWLIAFQDRRLIDNLTEIEVDRLARQSDAAAEAAILLRQYRTTKNVHDDAVRRASEHFQVSRLEAEADAAAAAEAEAFQRFLRSPSTGVTMFAAKLRRALRQDLSLSDQYILLSDIDQLADKEI
jgi:hypothetical protein